MDKDIVFLAIYLVSRTVMSHPTALADARKAVEDVHPQMQAYDELDIWEDIDDEED